MSTSILETNLSPEGEPRRDAKLLRALLDTILFAVWVVDPQGILTFTSGRAMETVGHHPGQFVGMSVFDLLDSVNADLMRGALAGTPAHLYTDVEGHPMENWYVPIRDDQGKVEAVVGVAMSLAEAKRTEKELRDRIAVIERQRQVIREMATPIIEVWDKVLTVPLVGVIDTLRAADLMENLLVAVARKGSRFAILDLTGVDAMDTSTASHLLKLVQALGLLGAEAIVTGIQPGVAQTMVALGVDMESITTQAKLRDGLRLCMRRQREEREGKGGS